MQCNIFVAQTGTRGIVAAMLSVVIPTLNAASSLPLCFRSLLQGVMRGLVREVIVADGGSTDATVEIAEAAGARIVRTEKGRGNQLAEGAAAARGDWLLFLHADTVLQSGWEDEAQAFVRSTFADKPRAASFKFALDDGDSQARRLETLVALRCRLLALPYGDQGLLVPMTLYRKLGGYRRLALLEDVDFVQRLGRRRIVMLRSRAVTSAERFRRDGYWRRSMRNFGILMLYALRVPVPLLARMYD